MTDKPSYACRTCHRDIDPQAPDTVAAHRQIATASLDGPTEYIDGEGVYFHRGCYPGDNKLFRRAR